MQPQPQKHVVALLSVIVLSIELNAHLAPKLCDSQILAMKEVLHALELQGLRWDKCKCYFIY
jgi:hypothetical protein